MAKSRSKLGRGAVALLLSGVVCKALGALFRLPLTNLLGLEGIGVFQLVMSLYAFALVLTAGGITSSLAKLISSARARGEQSKIKTYLSSACLFGAAVGTILGLIFALLFGQISALQGLGRQYSYILFVVLLPLGGVLAALRGFFQGYENMLPTALSQVVEQVFKFAFGLLFAYQFGRFGVAQGVFGAFLGIVLSEVAATAQLAFMFAFRKKEKVAPQAAEFSAESFTGEYPLSNTPVSIAKTARREFFAANFPLMLSAATLPLVNAFDSLFIVTRLTMGGIQPDLATRLYGLQTGVVGALLNFPLIISVAVTSALLPNISYIISRGADGRPLLGKGLKMLLFLVLPSTFGLVAISRQVILLFYSDIASLLNTAFRLMFLGGFSIVLTALMQYFVMLLQARGEFLRIMIYTMIGGLLKVLLSFFLAAVPSVNIFALVIGNIALAGIVCLLAIFRLSKTVGLSFSALDLFTMLFATAIMFVLVQNFAQSGYFSLPVNILISILLGMITYLVITARVIVKLFFQKKQSRRK